MNAQIDADIDEVAAATARLLVSLDALDDSGILAPSGLPGWTRGHVVAHIEGNARGMGRLLRQLRDGITRPMYVSYDVRNADVDLHAAWPASAHRAATEQSAAEFDLDARAVPLANWTGTVILGTGLEIPVERVLPQRLFEVCVHHADLAVPTYTWRDWPARAVDYFFPIVTRDFQSRGGFPVGWIDVDGQRIAMTDDSSTGLRGTTVEMLAWMLGRADGAGLETVGLDTTPSAPKWV